MRCWLARSRPLLVLALLIVLAGTAWAEYCKSQGSPRVPKSEIGPYDAAAFLTTSEIIASEARHLPWGRPDCPRILFHPQYVLCYDVDRKVALWASYRLEAADVVEAQRVNAFRTDPRLPIDQNPTCDDYAGSGFDRGHMVPRSDMNRPLFAMVNTFFLTNMTPQHPNVNLRGPGSKIGSGRGPSALERFTLSRALGVWLDRQIAYVLSVSQCQSYSVTGGSRGATQ